jgi:putative hydrolase of the HAD superfamily
MIDAVLLDVGGVLVLPETDVLLPAVHGAGAPGVTAGDLARGHYAGIAAMDRSALKKGITDWPAYHKALVAELGVPETVAEDVRGALERAYTGLPWTTIIPGAVDALRRLADTGVDIAIVSNSNGTVEEQLIAQRICQVGEGEGVRVVVVLDSYVVGVEKPHPAIFHRALDELGTTREQTLHVGDTGWADIAGARAAGIEPVHVDPYGFCPIPDDHEHVRDLDDLTRLVSERRSGQ